jgi:hypothetical protein
MMKNKINKCRNQSSENAHSFLSSALSFIAHHSIQMLFSFTSRHDCRRRRTSEEKRFCHYCCAIALVQQLKYEIYETNTHTQVLSDGMCSLSLLIFQLNNFSTLFFASSPLIRVLDADTKEVS